MTACGASTLIPIRKPTRNTVAAASSQTGQTGRNALPAARREPIQIRRPSEVEDRRVRERNAGEDVPLVEVPEGDGEEEQRDQVEVSPGKGPAQVAEPDQEDGAEPEPDPGVVDHRPAESARVSARHLPRDLRPRPRLQDETVRVVDASRSDLPGLAPPDLHVPGQRLLVVGRVGRAALLAGSASATPRPCARRGRPASLLLRQLRRCGLEPIGGWSGDVCVPPPARAEGTSGAPVEPRPRPTAFASGYRAGSSAS